MDFQPHTRYIYFLSYITIDGYMFLKQKSSYYSSTGEY